MTATTTATTPPPANTAQPAQPATTPPGAGSWRWVDGTWVENTPAAATQPTPSE